MTTRWTQFVFWINKIYRFFSLRAVTQITPETGVEIRQKNFEMFIWKVQSKCYSMSHIWNSSNKNKIHEKILFFNRIMARVSFTDLSSDDLNSSDESIFSDASYSDEEISYGETKGWVFSNKTQFLRRILFCDS